MSASPGDTPRWQTRMSRSYSTPVIPGSPFNLPRTSLESISSSFLDRCAASASLYGDVTSLALAGVDNSVLGLEGMSRGPAFPHLRPRGSISSKSGSILEISDSIIEAYEDLSSSWGYGYLVIAYSEQGQQMSSRPASLQVLDVPFVLQIVARRSFLLEEDVAIDAAAQELSCQDAAWAIVKLREGCACVQLVDSTVSAVSRARSLVHGRSLANALPDLIGPIVISSAQDVRKQAIKDRLLELAAPRSMPAFAMLDSTLEELLQQSPLPPLPPPVPAKDVHHRPPWDAVSSSDGSLSSDEHTIREEEEEGGLVTHSTVEAYVGRSSFDDSRSLVGATRALEDLQEGWPPSATTSARLFGNSLPSSPASGQRHASFTTIGDLTFIFTDEELPMSDARSESEVTIGARGSGLISPITPRRTGETVTMESASYLPIRRTAVRHPIDRALPTLAETDDPVRRALGRSVDSIQALPHTPDESVEAVQNAVRASVRTFGSNFSRLEATQYMLDLSENDEESRRLEQERKDFLAFQDAERVRIERIEAKKMQLARRREKGKRDSTIRRLAAEQRLSASPSLPPFAPPSEPLPSAPPSASSAAPRSGSRDTLNSKQSRGSRSPAGPPSPASHWLSLPSSDSLTKSERAGSPAMSPRLAPPESSPTPRKRVPEPLNLSQSKEHNYRDHIKSKANSSTASSGPRGAPLSGPGVSPLVLHPQSAGQATRSITTPSSSRFHTPISPAGALNSDMVAASKSVEGAPWTSRSSKTPTHLREKSDPLPTSPQEQTILEKRKQAKALKAEGFEASPWINKLTDRLITPRDIVSEYDWKDMQSKPQVPTASNWKPWTSPVLAAQQVEARFKKKLPPPPPMTPGTAQAHFSQSHPEVKAQLAEEAHRRAVLAEQAAWEQIRIAREMQEKLTLELAEVTRRGQERNLVEMAARAKWARDQAQRNQLDAFERSKLEGEESRRRRQVELARQEEEAQAREVAREKSKAEEREREALQEANRRKADIFAREAKLVDEEGKKGLLEEERSRRNKEKRLHRDSLKREMRKTLQGCNRSAVLTEACVEFQLGDSLLCKRRTIKVCLDQISLFKVQPKTTTAKAEAATEPLEVFATSKLSAVVEDAFEVCQMAHSCLLQLVGSGNDEDGEEATVIIACEKPAIKEQLLAAFEIVLEQQKAGVSSMSAAAM